MPSPAAAPIDTDRLRMNKLRGRFGAFEKSNPLVADAWRLCDQLTSRENFYTVDSPHSPEPEWLVSKKFDLFFVCGLAPWFLGLLAYFCTGGSVEQPHVGNQQQLLTICLVVASFLIGESHQFTSIIRYHSKTFRERRNSYFWPRLPILLIDAIVLPVAVAVVAQFVFGSMNWLTQSVAFLINVSVVPIMVTVAVMVIMFPAVLMQHFSAQAKAVGLTYCSRNNFALSRAEKLALSIVAWLIVISGVLTIAAPFVGRDVFFNFSGSSITGPSTNFRPAIDLLVKEASGIISLTISVTHILVAAFGLNFIVRGITRNEWLPLGAALTWLNMALFTLVPANWMLYVWLFVPVFFHASQHWAVAWSTQQREIKQNRIKQECFPEIGNAKLQKFYSDFRRLVVPSQILSVIVLFGTLIWSHLFGGSQFLAGSQSELPGMEVTLSAFLSILVFYCHYFTDRVVWRPTN